MVCRAQFSPGSLEPEVFLRRFSPGGSHPEVINRKFPPGGSHPAVSNRSFQWVVHSSHGIVTLQQPPALVLGRRRPIARYTWCFERSHLHEGMARGLAGIRFLPRYADTPRCQHYPRGREVEAPGWLRLRGQQRATAVRQARLGLSGVRSTLDPMGADKASLACKAAPRLSLAVMPRGDRVDIADQEPGGEEGRAAGAISRGSQQARARGASSRGE